MTYRELAARIAAMTPDQQDCTVKFLEPYDSAKIHTPTLDFLESEDEPITDEDDEQIHSGEPFLW